MTNHHENDTLTKNSMFETTKHKIKDYYQKFIEMNPYEKYEPIACRIKVVTQMFIGLLLTILLGIRAILYFFEVSSSCQIIDKLDNHRPLEIIALGLSFSAGIELSYMLFTDGPDEAIDPLILGLTSAALLVVSGITANEISWKIAAAILFLATSIGFLFWVRERFKINGSTKGDSKTTTD